MKARDLSNEDLAAILRSICVTGICPSRDEKEYLREAADRLEQKPETVTEFADRCRECGAKYGKLLKQGCGMTKEYREYAKSRIEYLLKISSFVFDERDRGALEVAIQALSQEPCDDAISRDELLKAIDTWDKFGVDDTNSLFRLDNLSLPHYVPYIHYDDVIKCIKGMPSVTQKSGRWKVHKKYYECSNCESQISNEFFVNYRFCPHCGARMESEE